MPSLVLRMATSKDICDAFHTTQSCCIAQIRPLKCCLNKEERVERLSLTQDKNGTGSEQVVLQTTYFTFSTSSVFLTEQKNDNGFSGM